MISAQEIAAMQSTVAKVFDLTCDIVRPVITSDGAGGHIPTYNYGAPTYPAVRCNLAQPSQQLLQNYDFLIGNLSAFMVGVPVGTDVQANDHLVVGGQILQVHALNDPHSYPTRLQVLAAEVR